VGIRKLSSASTEVQSIFVSKGDAVALLTTAVGQELLYFSSSTEVEASALSDLGAQKIRLIGCKVINQKLLRSWPEYRNRLERFVSVTKDIQIQYDPKNGKVQYRAKDSLEAQKTSDKKKVLIIDDSPTIRKLLSHIFESSNKVEVVGCVESADEARKFLEKCTPDLITLDIHMPGENGVEFLKSTLQHLDIPVVVVSALSLNQGPLVMEALSLGAITYIQKPSLDDLHKESAIILDKIETISEKKAIVVKKKTLQQVPFSNTDGLILIGSSTGGPHALEVLLPQIPKPCPPILIVQHIPKEFSQALAEQLNKSSAVAVKQASDGDVLAKNNIYIAPGSHHMLVEKNGPDFNIRLSESAPVNNCRPSVDRLFLSLTEEPDLNRVAVILTGMGKDGAHGISSLKQSGAKTIAQDEASSIVFGMPKRAIETGAIDRVAPIDQIGAHIVRLFNNNSTDLEKLNQRRMEKI